MRNLLGRLRRSGSRSLVEQLATLTSVGDGSTLSLDFTTGVLDPRLTFTRSTNATFINSSGLVQWAPANMVSGSGANSDNSFICYNTGATPNFETATLVSGPTGQSNEAASFTLTAAGFVDSRFGTVVSGTVLNFAIGLTYTVSFYYKALRGGSPIAITSQPFASGSTPESATNVVDVPAGNGFTYRTFQFTATATTYAFATVYGSGFQAGDVLVYSSIQVEPGTVARPYIKTTGTAYYGPRFDHDPTTGSPRGLLIEGNATNLLNWSESFATSGGTNNNWADTNITRNSTNNTDPANGTTALRVTAASANGTIISTAAISTSAQRTFSIWLRRVSGTGDIQYTLDNGSAYTTQAITSSWVRYTFAATTAAQRVGIRIVTSGDSIELWGAQLETVSGSGASSYIPTGSGQGTRNADVCYMANADYGFSTSGGTYLAEWHRGSIISTAGGGTNAFATDYASGRWLGIYTAGASSTGTAGSWAGYLNVSGGAVSGINKMAVSYSSWVASASGNTSLNGGAIVSGTLTLGTTPTYLFVGAASGTSPYSGGGYRDPLNNCVRRIKYWPSVLPNAQLQSLTT